MTTAARREMVTRMVLADPDASLLLLYTIVMALAVAVLGSRWAHP